MSSKVRAWLCLGLMTVQTLQTVAYLGSSFKILSEMKDIRFDLEIIFSLSTWSPLDCSRKCETHGRCRKPFIDGRDLDICFTFAGFHNLTEAKAKCATIQSSFISITSAKENEFLTRLVGTLLNIPFPDTSYTRPFIQGFWDGADWILDNGTPLVYTNWGPDQPKKLHLRKYLKLQDGKWHTMFDSKVRPVFCSYVQ
uniref:C-type lectin domain-containing protein n=1 Tax=Magallana gigas TaxID=29159 RepID=A0A8W8J1M2_MAGGI